MTPEQSADAAPPLTVPAPSAPGTPVQPAAAADPGVPPPMETKGVDAFFGRHHAVQGIDLLFPETSVTAIIGPSGCGKSTFLRCLNRMHELVPAARVGGQVLLRGLDLYGREADPVAIRRAVGMVFQRPNPLPISIYENIVFGLRIHSPRGSLRRGDYDEAVEAALREVLLWDAVKDRLRKRATGLQLEQQQKLCIARLLPLKPQVILMDEPCSALDAQGTQAIEELMGVLRERYTLVIVTHNMAQARRASDECIYMLLGKIVEHGRTVDVFLRPQHKETENYVEGKYG